MYIYIYNIKQTSGKKNDKKNTSNKRYKEKRFSKHKIVESAQKEK